MVKGMSEAVLLNKHTALGAVVNRWADVFQAHDRVVVPEYEID